MSIEGAAEGQSFVNDVNDGSDTVKLNDTVKIEVKKEDLTDDQAAQVQNDSHIGKTFQEMEEETKRKQESGEPLPLPLSR